jgi:hypothetical protein
MEDRFEKSLTPQERERFKVLLQEGKIVKYKTSPHFRKALYKAAFSPKPFSSALSPLSPEDTSPSSFEENGFVILEGAGEASVFSRQHAQKFRQGTLAGIKGFDGKYYVIRVSLLRTWSEKILQLLSQHPQLSLSSLAEQSKAKEGLVKTVCAFLCEEGEILEKRKGLYARVG